MSINAFNYWLKGLVGQPQPQSDGVEATARIGRQGDLILSELQPRYYEQAKRGNIFCMILQATTTGIAAGNITGAAAAASTQFAVVNPTGSGKDLVLLKLTMGVISGTTPVPPITHNLFNASQVSLAASGTIFGAYGNAGAGSVAKGYTSAGGAALTGGLALTAQRIASFNISAGTFSNLAGTMNTEEIAGDLIIPPGYGWVPCWAAAGTSVLGYYGVSWMEVPV